MKHPRPLHMEALPVHCLSTEGGDARPSGIGRLRIASVPFSESLAAVPSSRTKHYARSSIQVFATHSLSPGVRNPSSPGIACAPLASLPFSASLASSAVGSYKQKKNPSDPEEKKHSVASPVFLSDFISFVFLPCSKREDGAN